MAVCPFCKGSLRWTDTGASCEGCAKTYPRMDGVPHLLVGQPHGASDGRAMRLLENGRLYDWLQVALGYRTAARRLRAVLGDTSGRLVLDVGGGTGNLVPFLAPGTRYVCVDNDPGKIRRLLSVSPHAVAAVADATKLPFADESIDIVVCVAVTHHLPDAALECLVDELARVARERVIVLDPLRDERTRRGMLLWRIDRGSFPRSEDELVALLRRGLSEQHAERFAIHHRYLLWVGTPALTRAVAAGSGERLES